MSFISVSDAWWIFSIASGAILTFASMLFALHRYMLKQAREQVSTDATLHETLKSHDRLMSDHTKWLDDHEQRLRYQENQARAIASIQGDIKHMRERFDTELDRIRKKVEE